MSRITPSFGRRMNRSLQSVINWFLSRVALVSDDWYAFRMNDQFELESFRADRAGSRPLIVLIGRSQCFEVLVDIPTDDPVEATKICQKMPHAIPMKSCVRRVRVCVGAEGAKGRLSFIADNVVSQLEGRGIFVIPISWMLTEIHKEGAAVLTLPGETLSIDDDPYLQRVALDSASSPAYAGVDESIDIPTYDESHFLKHFIRGLFSISPSDWRASFLWNRPSLNEASHVFDIGQSVRWGAITFSLCLILSSAGIVAIGMYQDLRLNQMESHLEGALESKAQLNMLLASSNEWANSIAGLSPSWAIWPPTDAALEAGATLISLSFSGDKATAEFRAQDATTIFELFLESPFVAAAKLGSSLRRDRRTLDDIFTVEWRVLDQSTELSEAGDVMEQIE